MNSFKNSLISKISGIFTNNTEKETVPKVTEPKFPCLCGHHTKYPYLCKEAYSWYTLHNKTSLQDYGKLKRTYKV
jgi:hypothetical protein